MTLTNKQAKEIVSLVSADVISTARITGPAMGSFSRFVSARGWAGTLRNSALIYGAWMERYDPVFMRVCCYGIAEAVNTALHDERNRPRVSFATKINQTSRVLNGTSHDANGVWTKDGFHYVFDWWKTLDPDNPFIYRYADWLLDKNAVQFVNFTRF